MFWLPSINQSISQSVNQSVSQNKLSNVLASFSLISNSLRSTICTYLYIMHLLTFSPNKPWFLPVCSTRLLKTLREKEKLLVTSNFSFSNSVFYLFGELSAIFNKLKIVVCKLFQFGSV